MKDFIYSHKTATGEIVEGKIRAPSREEAIVDVLAQGKILISIKEEKTNILSNLSIGKAKAYMNQKEVANFCDMLAFMLESGMQIYNALGLICDGTTDKSSKRCIEELIEDIKQGKGLSQAMERHKTSFDRSTIYQIRAGEESSYLIETLKSIAIQITKDIEIKEKLKSALMYPAALMVVAVAVIYFMMTSIVPGISDVLVSMGGEIPLITVIVIAISDFLGEYSLIIAVALVSITVVLTTLYKIPPSRLIIDRIMATNKITGGVVMKTNLSKFCRTVGSMVDCGVPQLNALKTSENVLNNRYISKKIAYCCEAIEKRGLDLPKALMEAKGLPPLLIQLVTVGNSSSRLPEVLLKLSVRYEKEVDETTKRALTFVEPGIMFFIAVGVGTIMLSMFLPMFAIMDTF